MKKSTEPISAKLGTKHPWVKGIQVYSNEEPINSPKINNVFFSFLNQRYDIIICVYWFELFYQVSDVAHGPLVVHVPVNLWKGYTFFEFYRINKSWFVVMSFLQGVNILCKISIFFSSFEQTCPVCTEWRRIRHSRRDSAVWHFLSADCTSYSS